MPQREVAFKDFFRIKGVEKRWSEAPKILRGKGRSDRGEFSESHT